MTTLFVSDLHIDATHPEIGAQFSAFLAGEAADAEALYVLGDLFEAWLGDDDPSADKRETLAALKTLSESVPCYFMRGNRDFLAGERFSQDSGCTMLDDPTVVDLYGQRVLLMHGDTLCTDDVRYQEYRRLVRDPKWQAGFLALSIDERIHYAQRARVESANHISQTSDVIMDVNQQAVAAAMREHGVDLLLHGHTHRPAVHEFSDAGRNKTRIVLGDWYEHGSVVRWDESGFRLCGLERS